MPIKKKDKKNTQNFMNLLHMNKQSILVGTVTNYTMSNGFDAFSLSYVLENGANAGRGGSVKIPAYKYNEKALDKFKSKAEKLFRKQVASMIYGKANTSSAFNVIGIEASNSYKDVIIAINSPSNSLATIVRKGFNDPLIDTGKWVSNIGAKINNGRIVGRGLWWILI